MSVKKHSFLYFVIPVLLQLNFMSYQRLHTPSQCLYPTRKSLSASDDTGFKTETAALSLALTRCRF